MPAKTAMQMPNLQMPTGYEEEQHKIALKRKLAQAMFEQGIAGGQRARSPWDALASIAEVGAGKLHDKRANKLEAEMAEKLKTDYGSRRASLMADINAGMAPQAVMQKYGADTLLSGDLEPIKDAYGAALKNREGIVNFGGRQMRAADTLGKFDPGKPNDQVLRDETTGNMFINPVRVAAGQVSQMIPADNASAQALMGVTFNPNSQQQGNAPANAAAGSMPLSGPVPAGGGMDLSRLTPEEKNILNSEMQRRAGLSPEAQNFTGGQGTVPPPTAMYQNKPAWQINGKWYDNPEGK